LQTRRLERSRLKAGTHLERDEGVKATLTPCAHFRGHGHAPTAPQLSQRTRLYTIAALLIGYFGVNAYTGEHGLIAKRDLDQDIVATDPRA